MYLLHQANMRKARAAVRTATRQGMSGGTTGQYSISDVLDTSAEDSEDEEDEGADWSEEAQQKHYMDWLQIEEDDKVCAWCCCCSK